MRMRGVKSDGVRLRGIKLRGVIQCWTVDDGREQYEVWQEYPGCYQGSGRKYSKMCRRDVMNGYVEDAR